MNSLRAGDFSCGSRSWDGPEFGVVSAGRPRDMVGDWEQEVGAGGGDGLDCLDDRLHTPGLELGK